jgi:aminodeoxyfutalosine synthase
MIFRDHCLIPIWAKVRHRVRLSPDDGRVLLDTTDILALGQMAEYVKRQKSEDNVYFAINRYINPTNICALSCKFCNFARKKGEEGAYEMSIEDILNLLNEEVRLVHIVGAHHPDRPFEWYEDLLRSIHERYPTIQIKAFTASEIDFFWRRWKIPPEDSLTRLKQVGLNMLPGGGAEVFSERIFKRLFPGKASPQRWLEIHRIAHQMGIFSNATMLFGHIETMEERLQHFLMLRELQDETGGFITFIPLTYQVGSTRLVKHQTSPIDELRMVAVARLLLDNFPHIQAYWITLGEQIASIGVNFGADDLNGTLGDERIMHAAGAKSPAQLKKERIARIIRHAGYIPVEQDALHNVLPIHEEAAV